MKVDGSKFLVEKSHPLFSSLHLAAPGPIRFFGASSGEALQPCCSAQQTEHLSRRCMIETVVMLAIGLSMAGVVFGNLSADKSV